MIIATEASELPVTRLGSLVSPDETSKRLRFVDAALRCVASKGLRSTTVEEIALEASMARATLYRTFPGGREAVLLAVAETEAARFFASLSVELASAADLESLCVAFILGAARRVRASVLLGALKVERPEVLSDRVTFGGLDTTLALASDFAWPFFSQWMEEEPARRSAEFVARVTLSYLVSEEPGVSLTDEGDVAALVARHVLAGVRSLAS